MTGPVVGPAQPPPVVWVDNPDDPPSTVAYLHDVARYARLVVREPGRRALVLRPTPGGGHRNGVALDLLIALGKSPELLNAEHLRGEEAWDAARAWLGSSGVGHLVVDRAHQLPTAALAELASVARGARVRLWLIWSNDDATLADRAAEHVAEAGHRVVRLDVGTMREILPRPEPAEVVCTADAEAEDWPTFPTADFTTFRAACRRHLDAQAFARADALYRAAAGRAEEWATARSGPYGLRPPALADIAMDLVCWLRDTQLGPAPDPAAALIVLRATQAVLFVHAVLLRWQPVTLGPCPANRLPGDLAPSVTAAICALGRTSTAAVTALSLHLNLPPVTLSCLRCGDVAVDGSIITAPLLSTEHDHGTRSGFDSTSPSGVRELACLGTVRLPKHAWPVLAAHLWSRRTEGADDEDGYFQHPRDPGRDPAGVLREAAIRTCERLNLSAPWLHRDPCKYGVDIGITARHQGWMTERGLSLAQLDRDTAARVVHHHHFAGCHG